MELPPLDESQQMPRVRDDGRSRAHELGRRHEIRAGLLSARHRKTGGRDHRRQSKHRRRDATSPRIGRARHRHRRGADSQRVARRSDGRKGDHSLRRAPRPAVRSARRAEQHGARRSGRGPVDGRLQIVRKAGGHEQMLTDQQVMLEPGKRVFTVREQIDEPDFYTYEARFIPTKSGRRHDGPEQPGHRRSHTCAAAARCCCSKITRTVASSTCWSTRLRHHESRSHRPQHGPTSCSAIWPSCSRSTRCCWPTCRASSSATSRSKCWCRNTQNMGSGLVMLGGPNSFRRGRLDEHADRRSNAGRLPDQECQGRASRRLGNADARLGIGRRQLLAKESSPRKPSRRSASRIIAA